MEFKKADMSKMPNNRIAPKNQIDVLQRGAIMVNYFTDNIIANMFRTKENEELEALELKIEDLMMLKLFVREVQEIVALYEKHKVEFTAHAFDEEEKHADSCEAVKTKLDSMLAGMGIPAPKGAP